MDGGMGTRTDGNMGGQMIKLVKEWMDNEWMDGWIDVSGVLAQATEPINVCQLTAREQINQLRGHNSLT